MFHSTFPKLDIIFDCILNCEAAAWTSVTCQMPLRQGRLLRNPALEGRKYTVVKVRRENYVQSRLHYKNASADQNGPKALWEGGIAEAVKSCRNSRHM